MVISNIKQFVNRHIYLAFFLTTCISYGQMLLMYVWKDDNAIFFKFDHLSEPAGYLGRGLFGEGPYRLSVTPYWFIYKLFGTTSLVPYYVLAFLFYFFASIAIFKLFETFISKKAGIVAGLLFCAGYVSSEGFYWLASSWILSVSIILTCFAVRAYYQFVTKPSFVKYISAFLLYFLCIEITPVRTHYVIALIIAIELFWGADFSRPKKIIHSMFRVLPFLLAFYFLYIVGADSRTASLGTYFLAIKNKSWYEFYSFFATAGNIFITDIQSKFLFTLTKPIFSLSVGSLLYKFGLLFFGGMIVFRQTKNAVVTFVFTVSGVAWVIFSRVFLNSPQITLFENAQYLLYFSGILLLTLFFSSLHKGWRQPIFLIIWFVVSLSVYTSYIPTGYYSSIDRYVAHSFAALVGLIAFFVTQKNVSKVIVCVIFLWGISNVYSSFQSQKAIVVNRSEPARNFYTEFMRKLPEIKKGDVIYIDVAEAEREHYAAAFSVGQMPESTAIAWRYKLDRYDFLLVNNFADSLLTTKEGIEYSGLVHSFFYGSGHLTDTSNEYRSLKNVKRENISFSAESSKSTTKIAFLTPISNVRPLMVTVSLKARTDVPSSIRFPLTNKEPTDVLLVKNQKFRELSYEYLTSKKNFLSEASPSSSSSWQERVASNLLDSNLETVWQPDRILWHDKNQFLSLDMKKIVNINKVVWANGFDNNSPTSYSIETSTDGEHFHEVMAINKTQKIPSNILNEVVFEPTDARFIRIIFHTSLNDDSPGISEVFPVETRFKDYRVVDYENFLSHPFSFVLDAKTYEELVSHFNVSPLQVSWLSDKYSGFQTSEVSKLNATFDNTFHSYSLTVPAGGTVLKQLNFFSGTIPGDLSISRVDIQYE